MACSDVSGAVLSSSYVCNRRAYNPFRVSNDSLLESDDKLCRENRMSCTLQCTVQTYSD